MADRVDRKLVAGVRKGQPESFDALYELYKLPIFNFLYQMVGDVEEAKDLTQDSFIAIYNVLVEKRKVDNLRAYLYTIARNKALARMESRARVHIDDDYIQRMPDESYYADPERAMRNRKQQTDISKALQLMPEKYREVLVLREQGAFSYDAIAEMCGTNKTNVGVMLYRARSKFRELYRMLQVTEQPESEQCEKMLPLMSSWLDGETSKKQERELQAHMSDCPFCRLASEQMVEANSTFRSLIPLVLPLSVKAGLMAKVGLAGAVPTSLAASALSSAGGGVSMAAGGGAAAGSAGAATGVGSGSTAAGVAAGTASAVAVTGVSAKTVGIVAAALIAAAAVGGGTYVGVREAVKKPAVTAQMLQKKLERFMNGSLDKVEIPAALRVKAEDVRAAATRFLDSKLPELKDGSMKLLGQMQGSEVVVKVSRPQQPLEGSTISSSPSQESPSDCYLQVLEEQGEYQVERITNKLGL